MSKSFLLHPSTNKQSYTSHDVNTLWCQFFAVSSHINKQLGVSVNKEMGLIYIYLYELMCASRFIK